MTKEELKAELRAAYQLQKQINACDAIVQRLRSSAMRMTPAYSQSPAAGGGTGQKIENAAAFIADMEQRRQRKADELIIKRGRIMQLLLLVDDIILRDLMANRYLYYWSWSDIAADMHYSRRQVMRLHNEALELILLKLSSPLK